jgi:hypothetical protein
MRKANQREQEIEDEKIIQRQNAEMQARRDVRSAEDARRRMERTLLRSRVVEQQAKELARQTKRNDEIQEASESAAAQATMREIMLLKTKKEEMEASRHNEWLLLQKERTARRKVGHKRVFPCRKFEVDADEFDRKQRKVESMRLQTYLGKQMTERRDREKREVEDDIALDNAMIAATQAKFNQSLRSLDNLIPSELGITVPAYTENQSLRRRR